MIGLGAYPDVGLADAKGRRDEARRMLAESPPRDHAVHADWSQAAKRAAAKESVNTFQAVAEEWLGKQTLADNTRERNGRILGYLYVHLGERPMREIEAPDILDALREIEERSPEAASRGRQLASAVFQYAIGDRRATHDPAAGLAKSLTTPRQQRRPALTEPKAVGALLHAIDG